MLAPTTPNHPAPADAKSGVRNRPAASGPQQSSPHRPPFRLQDVPYQHSLNSPGPQNDALQSPQGPQPDERSVIGVSKTPEHREQLLEKSVDLAEAARIHGNYPFGAVLRYYTSSEPFAMCSGAIYATGIRKAMPFHTEFWGKTVWDRRPARLRPFIAETLWLAS